MPPQNEYVILLHGLGRSDYSMKKMASYLSEKGYQTLNVDYPSTQKPIEQIATDHILPAVNELKARGAKKIHFVTHSLGGIVLRQYLQDNDLPQGSRAVMLAPPNHGSELADFLKENPIYKWIIGPSGQQVGTDETSIPNRLKPVNIDVGVITGDKDSLPVFASLFPVPNDGKVSVESAKLSEMKAFKIISCGHTFIMNRKDVMEDVDHFFQSGIFKTKDESMISR